MSCDKCDVSKDKASWPRSMSKTGFFPIFVDTKEKKYENEKCDIPNDVLLLKNEKLLCQDFYRW